MHTEKLRTGRDGGTALMALWAFAEATVFFIVPDVGLTRMALRDFRRAMRACFVATAAALVGGAGMWQWGRGEPEAAEQVLARIPAIAVPMIADVRGQVERDGPAAMLRGPLTGVPYKIYAVECGRQGVPLGEFLAWSVPARLPRFLVLAALAAGVARLARKRPVERWLGWLHAGIWGAFYVAYFAGHR